MIKCLNIRYQCELAVCASWSDDHGNGAWLERLDMTMLHRAQVSCAVFTARKNFCNSFEVFEAQRERKLRQFSATL